VSATIKLQGFMLNQEQEAAIFDVPGIEEQ
jgi:hypothetical protein